MCVSACFVPILLFSCASCVFLCSSASLCSHPESLPTHLLGLWGHFASGCCHFVSLCGHFASLQCHVASVWLFHDFFMVVWLSWSWFEVSFYLIGVVKFVLVAILNPLKVSDCFACLCGWFVSLCSWCVSLCADFESLFDCFDWP